MVLMSYPSLKSIRQFKEPMSSGSRYILAVQTEPRAKNSLMTLGLDLESQRACSMVHYMHCTD